MDTAERRERDELIERHLPLVRSVLFQVAVHFPRHVDREELATAGALGLVEAASRFDASRGIPFEGFATQRIRGAMLDSARAADWAPRALRALGRKLDVVERGLTTEFGRAPSAEETASALGMTRTELSRLQDRMFRSVVLALDQTSDSDEDLTVIDVLADRTTRDPLAVLERRELNAYLRDAVKLLPERHRLVVVGYFIDGRKGQDLATVLGVTLSRISQLRSEALAMLRDGIEGQYRPTPAGKVIGRKARRIAGYVNAVDESSHWHDRLDNVQLSAN